MFKLFKIFIYLQVFSLNQVTIYGDNRYCDPAFCNNSKKHVLCKYQVNGPARHCNNYERTITSTADKQLVLDKINSRRNKVATGEIRSLRAAENMMTLKWNEELATSAQRWADQCVTHGVPDIKDNCRDLYNIPVGQNIATIYDDAPGLTPAMLVDLWYIELLNVNSSVITKYQGSSETGSDNYEYFTQLVWAETAEVGCGAVKFKEQIEGVEGIKNRTVYRLVCNFAPAGNLIGKSVYSNGLPCSRCRDKATCDFVYKSLCCKFPLSKIDVENTILETKQNDILNVPAQYNISSVISDHDRSSVKQLSPMSSFSQMRSKYLVTTEANNANIKNDTNNVTEVVSWPESSSDYDENISFDFFTDLFEQVTKSSPHITENTTVCKEVLIVDELFDLLKRKLNNDQTLRNLLLSSKSSESGNTEETFTDLSVADILSHIYTTKVSTTTTKATNDYLNSTLLVDLVEALIFRNNAYYSTSAVLDAYNQTVTEVYPVKIRAEFGETNSNSDFTGHYFFPEDNNDETSSDKQKDDDYDTTDFSVSDVSFEIEDLKRYKGTKDFLDEVLDSDFITETISQMNSDNPSSDGNSTS